MKVVKERISEIVLTEGRALSQIRSSNYEAVDSCVICNTDVVYPISGKVFAVPITSI